MKFFTQELYLRFNSTDGAIADRAEAEWEEAVSAYHAHLGRFSDTMNDRVRKLAEEVCLHDAELLALREDVVNSPTMPPTKSPVVILSLQAIGRVYHLFYLSWGELLLSTAPHAWPFSPLRLHWLYDEIDRDPGPTPVHRYYHRIMLSDGREISIPFHDVIVHSYTDQDPGPPLVTRNRP